MASSSLELTEGVRVVGNSMALNSLTIAEGASLVAPEGKSLTMTVFGIGTAIKPGYYKGDIFITVSDKYFCPGGGRGGEPPEFRSAILIEDGKYVPEKSVPAIVRGGKVTDKATTGIAIMGVDDNFNGIVVDGDSEYTIEGIKIDFEGEGGNDFIGYGAAIANYGNSKVTINNSEIKLKSPWRCALHCGGNSITTLNNCRLINESPDHDTKLPPTWVVGFRGTNRVTQLCDNATVYYNNCYIQGNGWGVLSIDGGQRVRMYVKDSTVELSGPRAHGYGAFSIGDALVSYDHCTVSAQGYPLLMGGHEALQNGEITNGTVINSTLCAVMIFRDFGSELKVNKGSTLNSDSSTFVVKGSNTYINIDDAVMNPSNGVILQLMDNDEGGMGASHYVVPIGADVPIPGRDLTVTNPKEDVFMTVSNTEVKGDFYNSTTNLTSVCIENPSGCAQQGVKNLDLKFANAKVNGIISAASESHREGVLVIDEIDSLDLTRVTQTAQEPVNNGVIVSFDNKSVWTVAGTSYLTSLTVANGAVIKAPEGKTLTMTVDGVQTQIGTGTYKGKIVLTTD